MRKKTISGVGSARAGGESFADLGFECRRRRQSGTARRSYLGHKKAKFLRSDH